MKWSVEVDNLTRTFGDFVAVDRVSFAVSPGEIFGFLGSNGAGKTTTIRMLCGLLAPSSGEARVLGLDVGREPERVKQRIGYMSQRFSLYDDLTVQENLRFFGGIYGLERGRLNSRIEQVLSDLDLSGKRRTLTRLLAGGWKQRLALACAILHSPPILFLDEPTSGVDPLARRSFWQLINELSTSGQTVFVTTHYMDEAEYCQRLALMEKGRIIALGTPTELKQKSKDHALIRLETSDLRRTLQLLPAVREVKEFAVFGAGFHLRVTEPAEASAALVPILESQGVQVRRFERIPPSMEDVFVSLVQDEQSEGSRL